MPPALTRTTSASYAASTGSASPAGLAVPRFPPTVPRLRICGEPTVRDACTSAGNIVRRLTIREYVTPAPRKHVPSCVRHAPNSGRRLMSRIADGRRPPSVPPGAPVRLAVSDITKTFPGVTANDRVTMDVRGGEVHALLGENGAGKTTLMNILYGLYQPDAGEIVIDGRAVRIRSPRDAIAYGIGMVPQHFLLVRRHTVAENIALGFAGTRFFLPARDVETQ